MARPRQFEEQQALDRALEVFWRRGYDACSIDDLIAATGIKRQGLYNTFGDKDAMFLAALAQYRAHLDESLRPLEKEDAGIADIKTYMLGVLEAQRAGNFGACLLVKTAFAPDLTRDARVSKAVREGAEHVRSTFKNVIAGAVARGEVSRGTKPETYAAYLYALLNGLSALGATGASAAAVKQALVLAVAA